MNRMSLSQDPKAVGPSEEISHLPAVTEPAWKGKPSWYLVAAEDKMIPPPAQRQMAARAGAIVAEATGSHAIYVSKPETVAGLIAKAAGHLASN